MSPAAGTGPQSTEARCQSEPQRCEPLPTALPHNHVLCILATKGNEESPLHIAVAAAVGISGGGRRGGGMAGMGGGMGGDMGGFGRNRGMPMLDFRKREDGDRHEVWTHMRSIAVS